MLLSVEVARLVERERRRDLERRLPSLVALREQRAAKAAGARPPRAMLASGATGDAASGPRARPRTDPAS